LEYGRSGGILPGLGLHRVGQKGREASRATQGTVGTMDEELKRDTPYDYTQIQEQLWVRLQPTSDLEAYLIEQMARCRYQLEQIENRLTKAWSQLNKIHEELR
jgi:hypothetical protein